MAIMLLFVAFALACGNGAVAVQVDTTTTTNNKNNNEYDVRVLQGSQSSNNIGSMTFPGQNSGRQITVGFEYEVQSANPSSTMTTLDSNLHTDLYRAITDHDGDLNPTLIIDRVQSETIGDCVDDTGLATTQNCLLARGAIQTTLNRPQFLPDVAIQGLYDVVRRYLDEFSNEPSQLQRNTVVRMVYPTSVSTTFRIGFRQFESVIDENERQVISDAFQSTITPIMNQNGANPSYDISAVSVIVQDVRNTYQYNRHQQRQRQRQLDLVTEDLDLVLWTDLFVRGHCRVTDPACNDEAFNTTLYQRLPQPMDVGDGSGTTVPGLDVLLTNLRIQGRNAGTDYFENLQGVVIDTAADDYYAGIDINDEKGLLDYQYRDPDDYDQNIPIWLWLFLFASIIIIVVGVPILFCAQHQWEKGRKRRKQEEEDLAE